MNKNVDISLLLDFYGDILTKKQHEVIGLYYNEDLSLSEIAEILNITRQGVHDSIKRGEAILYEMDEKLGLTSRFAKISNGLEEILRIADDIISYNQRIAGAIDINKKAEEIKEIAEKCAEYL